MIYSKTGKFHHIPFDQEKFKLLDDCLFETDAIFYHHHYDSIQQGIRISNAVDGKHWNHLKRHPESKLLHENCGETFDENFAKDLAAVVNGHGINPSQIYVLVMDSVHKQFLEEKLSELNVSGINIEDYNFLLDRIEIPKGKTETFKLFSALSRNYRAWRLYLYATLAEQKLLDNFIYSFYNIHPYEGTEFSFRTMTSDLENLNFDYLSNTVTSWMQGIPYKLSSTDNVLNKWGDVTYSSILGSKFHLLIETHYDPLQWTSQKTYRRSFAPSSITEKTYKPIACRRPFIVFSTPYFLDDLRKLGFKTFHPYIDESYDTEVDNKIRLKKIVSEIERISKLTESEQTDLLNNLSGVLEHNLKILKSSKPSIKFKFIEDYVQTNSAVHFEHSNSTPG